MNWKTFLIVIVISVFGSSFYYYYQTVKSYEKQLVDARATILVLEGDLANKNKEIQILKSSQEISNQTIDELIKESLSNKNIQDSVADMVNELEKTTPDWNSQPLPSNVSNFLNNADKAWRENKK